MLRELSAVKFAWFRSPISNGALKGKDLPNEIRVLGNGDNPNTRLPKLLVGEVTQKILPQNQVRFGHARVPICYDHCLDEDAPEYVKGAPKAIFGYGDVQLDPQGIKLSNVTWTPLGEREARNYEDISPTVAVDAGGNVVFVRSVSLTPAGSVHGLHFFSALGAEQNEENHTMNEISLAEWAAAFGLNTTASKDQVLAEVKGLHGVKTAMAGLAADVKAIKDANPGKIVLLTATVEGKEVSLNVGDLIARLNAMDAKVTGLTAATEGADKNKVISLFASDGKVPMGEDGKPMSVEALSALTLPELRRLHANTPSTVPLNARGGRAREKTGAADLKGVERAGQEWAHLEK